MFIKMEKRQQLIDIREAFNIWDILCSKYLTVELLQNHESLAHDIDLKGILKGIIKALNENIAILEKLAKTFAIKTPDRNRTYSSSANTKDIIADEFIALDLLHYYQEHIENMSKAMRSTVTNDYVRKTFKKMALKTIDEMDTLVKYLHLKGWLSAPPLYKHIPTTVKEKLSLSEAANLWDHLTLRYDNIRTTEYYLSTIHDIDFKAILKMGQISLEKQTEKLEKELKHYGIPLPKRPSKATLTINNTEVLDDDYMYRILINALQGAVILHAQSYKECLVCDRIRFFFKQLLIDELNYIDNFIKFGKMKSWLNPVSLYGP